MQALTNTSFTAVLHGADTGLAGVITVEVYDPVTGIAVIAASAVGITEPRSGTYRVTLVAPDPGEYVIRWEYTDAEDSTIVAEEDLEVLTTLVPETRPDAIETAIAIEARDLLPETWAALSVAKSFGLAALQRRHDRAITSIFGQLLTPEEQELLDNNVIRYAGKMLALSLLAPAIDYWSKQILSHTAGERESRTYKDRVEDLKELRKQWTSELADLWIEVVDLIPTRAGRAGDAPRIINAGDTVGHATANPYDLGPAYGAVEETA